MISERISDDTPPQMKILNMVRHPSKCDVINDVKIFPTVYRRIYCRKFLTLSNQTSRYESKCIRIPVVQFNHQST